MRRGERSDTTLSSEIDEIDKRIIRELQNDGRVPYAQLAPLVGLSQGATRQRVQRLIETGVMQVVAVTDPVVLGFTYQAMLGISVSSDAEAVADDLAKHDAVEYLVLAAGRFDILAEVTCATADDLLTVINQVIRPTFGVAGVETLNYLRVVKQTYDWGTH